MVSLDLMKSSEDRIAGDQPKYKKSSKIATFFKQIIIRLWADEDYQDYECFLMLETIFETLIAAYIMHIRVHLNQLSTIIPIFSIHLLLLLYSNHVLKKLFVLNILFYLRSSIETDKNKNSGQQYVQKRVVFKNPPLPNLDYSKNILSLQKQIRHYGLLHVKVNKKKITQKEKKTQ